MLTSGGDPGGPPLAPAPVGSDTSPGVDEWLSARVEATWGPSWRFPSLVGAHIHGSGADEWNSGRTTHHSVTISAKTPRRTGCPAYRVVTRVRGAASGRPPTGPQARRGAADAIARSVVALIKYSEFGNPHAVLKRDCAGLGERDPKQRIGSCQLSPVGYCRSRSVSSSKNFIDGRLANFFCVLIRALLPSWPNPVMRA